MLRNYLRWERGVGTWNFLDSLRNEVCIDFTMMFFFMFSGNNFLNSKIAPIITYIIRPKKGNWTEYLIIWSVCWNFVYFKCYNLKTKMMRCPKALQLSWNFQKHKKGVPNAFVGILNRNSFWPIMSEIENFDIF